MADNKKSVLWAAVLIAVLATSLTLSGCASCSGPASSASSGSSASVSVGENASSGVSVNASASASASEETALETLTNEPEANVTQESGSGSQSSSGGNQNGNSNQAGGPVQPAHQHSWVWVPNVVTVVDEDAYDEPVYRWAEWCNACNCEVPGDHGKVMMMQGEKGHTVGALQVIDHYVHYDAVTHTEDRGYEQCAGCGATR